MRLYTLADIFLCDSRCQTEQVLNSWHKESSQGRDKHQQRKYLLWITKEGSSLCQTPQYHWNIGYVGSLYLHPKAKELSVKTKYYWGARGQAASKQEAAS